jgi:hypothetical protein
MVWNADENGLLGAWHELEPGAAMSVKVGVITADIFRQTGGWHLMVPLANATFSVQLLRQTAQDFPDYHLLLLHEHCYLHRRYAECTAQILSDIHYLAEELRGWSC